MTRKEEIERAAMQIGGVHPDWDALECFRVGYKEGAKWADKTLIDKARQWFNLHFRQVGTPKEIKHNFESKERMWKSFTQFMEE